MVVDDFLDFYGRVIKMVWGWMGSLNFFMDLGGRYCGGWWVIFLFGFVFVWSMRVYLDMDFLCLGGMILVEEVWGMVWDDYKLYCGKGCRWWCGGGKVFFVLWVGGIGGGGEVVGVVGLGLWFCMWG